MAGDGVGHMAGLGDVFADDPSVGSSARVLNFEVRQELKPPRPVMCAVELPGTPHLLTGDGRGFLVAWYLNPSEKPSAADALRVPDQQFEAHAGSISTVTIMQSTRIANLVQDQVVSVDMGVSSAPALSRDAAVEKRRVWDRFCCCCCCKKKKKAKVEVVEEDDEETDDLQILAAPKPKEDKRHWFVASGGGDGVVRFWRWSLDLSKGRKQVVAGAVPFDVDFVSQWRDPDSEQAAPVVDCQELHDGFVAVALGNSPDIRLVDAVTGTAQVVLYGHTGPVSALTELGDGRLASGGQDGSVRLWRQRTWMEPGMPTKAGGALVLHTKAVGTTGTFRKIGRDVIDRHGKIKTESLVSTKSRQPLITGVCEKAFYAHTAFHQRGDSVSVVLRVLVQRVESLKRKDSPLPANSYVTVQVVEGEAPATIETPTGSMVFNYRCALPLRRSLLDGIWQVPECALLEFEVHTEGKKATFLAYWSISVAAVMAEIKERGGKPASLSQRKLRAPPGYGPFQELQEAFLTIGFDYSSEHHIDCSIGAMVGYNPKSSRTKFFARVKCSHSRHGLGAIRQVPCRPSTAKTATVEHSNSPAFNEVLEVALPAYITDSAKDGRISYPPNLQIIVDAWHVENASKGEEELLGSVSLSVEDIKRLGDKKVGSFRLLPMCAFKQAKGILGLGQGHGVKEKGSEVANTRILLAFQMVTPCSIQLKCDIKNAVGLPPEVFELRDRGAKVRVRLNYGNPLLPKLTAVKTKVVSNSLSPVFNERCALNIPTWLVEDKTGTDGTAPSVKAGWEHEGDATMIFICLDAYHERDDGPDEWLCRASLPYFKVLAATLESGNAHASRPRPVKLSGAPHASLHLGYEVETDRNTNRVIKLNVIVSHAEGIPHTKSGSRPNIYLMVRLGELGAFNLPTDTVEVSGVASFTTQCSNEPNMEEPSWNHEATLELPGLDIDGHVRVQPKWYVLFDVIAPESWQKKEELVCQTAVSLTQILGELANKEIRVEEDDKLWARRSPLLRNKLLEDSVRVKLRLKPAPSGPAAASALPTTPQGKHRGRDDDTLRSAARSEKPSTPQPKLSAPSTAWDEREVRPKSTAMQLSVGFEISRRRGNQPRVRPSDSTAFGDADASTRASSSESWRARSPGQPSIEGTTLNTTFVQLRPMTRPSTVTSLVALVSSLAAGYENGQVYIWDTTGSTPTPLHGFEAHSVPVTSLQFLGWLDCLASVGCADSHGESAQSKLRVWNCSTMALQQQVQMHGAFPRCLVTVTSDNDPAVALKPHEATVMVAADLRQTATLQVLRFSCGPLQSVT